MKKSLLVSLVAVASSATLLSAADPEAGQVSGAPKNLARHHLGANLFQYSPGTQAYSPTQAAAAWLDDDITTGWPAMMGKQYYLLALPETATMTNFAISARPTTGTVSLYAGDEPAPPTSKSWVPVAQDVPLESVNEKRLEHAFSRTAKYLLIETDIADPGPIYSLYVYGDRPAASYTVHPRAQAIDVRAVFGPNVNDQTAFNVAALYEQASVKSSDGTADSARQAAIDDNPETAVTLGGNSGSAELPITLAKAQEVSRIAMEVTPGARGRFDFYLTDAAAADAATGTPAASIVLDGSNARASVDFSPTHASMVRARWTPANGNDAVEVREVEAFAGQSLASNSVILQGTNPDAETGGDRVASRSKSDGKDTSDPKAIAEGKQDAAPIAEFNQGPYLPGALGFPPNLTRRGFRVPPPQGPLSP